jgi:DNA-binding NtrC family response regulator
VRELRNSLERAAILCEGGTITPDHLAFANGWRGRSITTVPVATPGASAAGNRRSPGPPAAAGDLETAERAMIAQALERSRFNKSKAARDLGLTRQQLYVRLRRYGLE